MVRITDLNAISEYRKRRSARIDSKNWADELNFSNISGEVKPTVAEVPKEKVVFARLSNDMKPMREYRFLADGEIMGFKDWLKANRRVLNPLYKDGGMDAVCEEYYKGLMVNASRGLKQITAEDTDKIIDDRLDEEYLGSPNDEKYRRKMIRSILKDREGRNAALNLMYDNYCKSVDGCKGFEDFLNTPIKVYKVGSGHLYSSYLFENEEGRDELLIRPIDTFGSIRRGLHGAVMVPNWRTHGEPEKDDDGWDWREKDKWVFEQKEEETPELEIISSIKGECEVAKIFEHDNSDVAKEMMDRCADSIQRLIKRLALRAEEVHTDSAFFSGELNDNLGERNVLYPEIDEFRERRQKRLDAKFEESKHPRGKDGKFTSGNGESVGLSRELKPANSDYDYDSSDDFMQFVHKNVEKTRPIYKEKGMNGVEDEWFKTRLADCTKDLKPISDDEIDSAFEGNIDRGVARLWLQEYNNGIKDKLVMQMTNNPEVHNAALNVMYKNYADSVERNGNGKPLPFEEFLVTPIKMYRGGSGKEYKKAGAFSSYTFSEEIASRFKNGPTGHESEKDGVIYEAEIRPIDTYGSLNTSGEAEILVPRMIAPNGRKDAVEEYRKRRQKRLDARFEENEHPRDDKGRFTSGGIDRETTKIPYSESVKFASADEAKDTIRRNVRKDYLDGWFRHQDREYKPVLKKAATESAEMRSACLSMAYDQYKKVRAAQGEKPLPFDKFLTTPITVYRGGSGKGKIGKYDAFKSYTFSKDVAKYFAGDEGTVTEKTVRPIDTYGSMGSIYGETEIWIPKEILVKSNSDAKDDEGRWITTENNHKVHLNEEGEPDKGNPHVIEKMERGSDIESEMEELEKEIELEDLYRAEVRYKGESAKKECAEELKGYRASYRDRREYYELQKSRFERLNRMQKKLEDGVKKGDTDAKEKLDELKESKGEYELNYRSAKEEYENVRDRMRSVVDKYNKEIEKAREETLKKYPNYESIKSTDDAEEYLKAKGICDRKSESDEEKDIIEGEPVGGEVDLARADKYVARGMCKTIDKIQKKFPEIGSVVKSIKVVPDEWMDGAVGATTTQGDMEFSDKYFKLTSDFSPFFKGEFHPTKEMMKDSKTAREFVISHEFGHRLDELLCKKCPDLAESMYYSTGVGGKWVKTVASSVMEQVAKNMGKSVNEVKRAIGRYACKNEIEALAEAFGEYMVSENPRAVASEVGKQIESLYRNGKLIEKGAQK